MADIIVYHSEMCYPCNKHLKNFKKVAEELGVEFEVRDALKNDEYRKVGIDVVPATFINGKIINGAMTQQEIRELLEEYQDENPIKEEPKGESNG